MISGDEFAQQSEERLMARFTSEIQAEPEASKLENPKLASYPEKDDGSTDGWMPPMEMDEITMH